MNHLTTPAPCRMAGVRRPALRERIQQRRRLAEQDRRTARLAELCHIGILIGQARIVIGAGWVQHGWFIYRDETGAELVATEHDLNQVIGRPVVGACLVGAIVQAGGGPARVSGQPVQRALDLTWHTLYGGERQPVRWCPAPAVRAAHVRDLTQWNDQPGRTRHQVIELLHAVDHAAAAQVALNESVRLDRPPRRSVPADC